MSLFSKMKARRLGESISIVKAKDGFNVVRLHFPISSIPGKPQNGFSVGVSNGCPQFKIEPAFDAFDEKANASDGSWDLVLVNHINNERSVDPASERAAAPLVLASFINEDMAKYALDIANASAMKHFGKSHSSASRLPQWRPILKWSFRIGLSMVAVAGLSFLVILGATTIKTRDAIVAVSAKVKSELPSSDTAIHYGPGTTDRSKIIYIFTDPGCTDCKKYHQISSELQRKGFDVWIFPLSVMEGSDKQIASVMCSRDRVAAWDNVMKNIPVQDMQNCMSKDAGSINTKLFDAFHFRDAPTTILGNGVVFEGVKDVPDIEKLAQSQPTSTPQ